MWQTDSGCSHRSVSDVSAVADPNTGVSTYDSYGGAGGWGIYGGTSAAAPIVGAMYALADNPASNGKMPSFPYTHTQKLNDVTSGSNGSCSRSYLCTAVTGYDGPTGLGTPNTADAFSSSGVVGPPPPVAPDFSISAAALHSPLRPNGTAKSTVTITPLNGDTGVVSLAVLTTPHVGLTTTLAPRSVTLGSGSKTSTLSFTGHTGGTYTVTVTATQGALTHTTQLVVVVNDFVLKVSAPKHSVRSRESNPLHGDPFAAGQLRRHRADDPHRPACTRQGFVHGSRLGNADNHDLRHRENVREGRPRNTFFTLQWGKWHVAPHDGRRARADVAPRAQRISAREVVSIALQHNSPRRAAVIPPKTLLVSTTADHSEEGRCMRRFRRTDGHVPRADASRAHVNL